MNRKNTTYITNLLTPLAVLLMSWMPIGSRAQQLQASLNHYTTDDGLASNSIAYLTQDDYGYVWIATWSGATRFDGYNFYNYRAGNASGIKGMHNRIDAMTADQQQNIWLKMYDGRIFVINRKTDRIEDPLEGVSGHTEFRADYFYNLYVTSSGDVLVSFPGVGLYKMRADRKGEDQQLIMTGQLTATDIVEGYQNDIWVGTDKGVHRIDMPNLALERKGYFLDEHITRLTSNGYNIFAGTKSGKIMQFSYGQEPKLIKDTGREVTGLYIDSHNVLWYSDLGDGTYRLNLQTGESKHFVQHVLVPEFSSRGAYFHEAMGVLWVRLNHGGYGYYNRQTDEIEYFHNDPSNSWNLSNSVNASLEMNDGVVWESTSRHGLDKLEVQKNTIMRILPVPGAESSLENETRAMLYDHKRNLTLLGNKKGKLFIIDDKGNTTVLTHDSNGNPFSRAYGLAQDHEGNYWMCDKDKGIYKITPNAAGGYTIINICHDDKDKWSLSANSAYQSVEDKNGNIWVATYGGGVNILRKDRDGRYIALNDKNVLRHYPRNGYKKVRTIALASDGTVWAGTTDGILIMSIRNNKVTMKRLEAPDDMSKGLMSNDIVCLASDREGVMWVGTNSGGLSHTTKKDQNGNWQFENYGIEDGMPSEEILGITFDNDNNVWFSTDHIICSFNRAKRIFTSFSQLDGVDDTMFSEGAAITTNSGNILFGTLNGYYVVDRKKLTNKKGSLLKLRITDFYVDGVLQTPRKSSLFDYYVPESKEVRLPENGMDFAFRFAALNYQVQHRLHYQYMLEGYDDDWQNAGKDRMASYSGVSGGTYTFRVKTFLLESPDAFDERVITVIVPRHPLLSATALVIYLVLLLIGAGVWWLLKQRRNHAIAQRNR